MRSVSILLAMICVSLLSRSVDDGDGSEGRKY